MMTELTLDYRNIPEGKMYLSFGAGFSGVDPDKTMTTDEMLAKTGLDWQVEQLPAGYQGEDGWHASQSGKVSNVRSDNGYDLGYVSKGYHPMQNAAGFAFADELVQTGNGGWIGGREFLQGRRVCALMRLNRDIKIGGIEDERILPLLAFLNGHDGNAGVSLRVAPFRAACMNGMMVPMKNSIREWRYRHTRGIKGRMQEARKALEISWTYYDELEELGNKLVAKKMSGKQLATFLDRLVPLNPKVEPDSRTAKNRDEAIDMITSVFQSAPNLENVRGTEWAALQAVAEYDDWHRRVMGKTDVAQAENRNRRQLQPSKIKDRAVALLVA